MTQAQLIPILYLAVGGVSLALIWLVAVLKRRRAAKAGK